MVACTHIKSMSGSSRFTDVLLATFFVHCYFVKNVLAPLRSTYYSDRYIKHIAISLRMNEHNHNSVHQECEMIVL